jgi:hypothetical protein
MGYSADAPSELARTILSFMVKLRKQEDAAWLSCVTTMHLIAQFKSLRPTDSDTLFKTPHPVDSTRELYLLFDPVHLMKCIRNNWLSEKKQALTLLVPVSANSSVTGKWGDIKDLYEREKTNIVKRTTLTSCAVYSTNIERVKVPPVLQVFNEKTVAALTQDGLTGTAGLIFHILRMWKILNNKSTKPMFD